MIFKEKYLFRALLRRNKLKFDFIKDDILYVVPFIFKGCAVLHIFLMHKATPETRTWF